MTLSTLLRYLIGERRAILTIAGSRHALWLSLLFVLSAGLAREYDGEDLLHQPWYAIIPVGASLASSFVLFAVTCGIAGWKGAGWRPFFSRYFSFLGLFWLTAPLAWLYAVPYEHFLSPGDAMRANLWTLGVVAAWRVFLMVRVLMVLMNFGVVAALSIVLVFADVVALTLITFLPVPLIDVMGGIRLSERDRILRGVACLVVQLGVCSFPFWVIGVIAGVYTSQPKWAGEDVAPAPRPSIALQALAIGSVLVWVAVLPFTQPPQVRRWHVEQAFRHGDIERALREMSQYERWDYPPGWEPPPRQANLYEPDNALVRVLELLGRVETADWVREAYLDKAAQMLGGEFLPDEEVRRIATALRGIRGGTDVVGRMRDPYMAQRLREALAGKTPKEDAIPDR